MKTLDSRSLEVERLPGGTTLILVNGRRLLKLPAVEATALAEALTASSPFGDRDVCRDIAGKTITLRGYNDEIVILRAGRAVFRIRMEDRFDLSSLIAGGAGAAVTVWRGHAVADPSPLVVADAGVREEVAGAAADVAAPFPATGAETRSSDGTPAARTAGDDREPPAHRSNSQVKLYADCAYRYYLERMAPVDEASHAGRPSVAMLAGSAAHKAIETFERHAWLAYTNPFVTLTKQWPDREWAAFQFTKEFGMLIASTSIELVGTEWENPDSWSVAAKGVETIGWWMAAGPKFLTLYADNNPRSRGFHTLGMYGELFIEHELNEEIAGVPVKGYIDHVTIDQHGTVDVIDFKPREQDDRGFQVVVYAKLLARKYPDLEIRGGSYLNYRDGKITSYRLDSWSWEEIEHIYSHSDHGITAGVFPPSIGRHCSWCSMRRHCKFGSKPW